MRRWEICLNCDGEGCHAKKLGIINLEDWDDDSLENYMNGAYDSACEVCNGSGKVLAENNKPIRYYSSDEEYFRNRDGGY